MINKAGLLFLIVLLSGCAGNKQDKPVYEKVETEQVHTDTLTVTPVFLSLIKHLDSVGYIYDTARYGVGKGDSLLWIEDYAVYKVDEEKHYWKKKDIEEFYGDLMCIDDSKSIKAYSKDYDEKSLSAVKHIYQYYSRVKKPDVDDSGNKWWIDGIVEEWQFDTPEQAGKAAGVYGKYSGMLFFKSGGRVVGIDNCMYLFTARASGFVYYQDRHIDWLKKTYNAKVY